MNNFSVFKRFGIGALLFIISLLVCDFFVFELAFKQYDKLNHLNRIKKPTDILLIGASNILWDVDPSVLSLKTGLQSKMIAVAGGDIEFRYQIAKEFLKRHKKTPPKLIIFHTDTYLFSKERYSSQFYLPLQGYYHKGILKEYIRKHWQTPRAKFLNMTFRCYTLNSNFLFIGSKVYDKFASPINQIRNAIGYLDIFLPKKLYARPRKEPRVKKSQKKRFTFSHLNLYKNDAQKVASWKKKYLTLDRKIKINQNKKEIFHKSADLFEQAQVQVVFLETPIYDLFDGVTPNEKARKILQSRNSKYIHYLRVQPSRIEKDLSLYFDASHMNFKGRSVYSHLLAIEIQKYLTKK